MRRTCLTLPCRHSCPNLDPVLVTRSIGLFPHSVHSTSQRVKFETQFQVCKAIIFLDIISVHPRFLWGDGTTRTNISNNPSTLTFTLLVPPRCWITNPVSLDRQPSQDGTEIVFPCNCSSIYSTDSYHMAICCELM